MATYRRTRVLAQDMKTGEFAYLDQLINDGYYPNLKVLPKNWEPAQRTGPSPILPLEPIFNFSPPNIFDTQNTPIINLISDTTNVAILLPLSVGSVGKVTQIIDQNIDGISSVGSIGSVTQDVAQNITGISSIGSVGSVVQDVARDITGISSIGSVGGVTQIIDQNITGISSVGSVNAAGVMQVIVGNVVQLVTGISSQGSVGTVLNGTGWGRDGWGVGPWGTN